MLDDRSHLGRAYADALAAYRQVLATLHSCVLEGNPTREAVGLELEVGERLDKARSAYLNALRPGKAHGPISPRQ